MASSCIKIGFIATGLILSLSSTTSFAKEYYKWVDAKGSTHYTTTPPPKSAKKKGKVDTYGAAGSASHAAHANADKEAQNAAAEKEAQNHANAGLAAANAAEAPSTPMKKSPSVSAAQRAE
ncbi:DUF4124 domain-containing protein [Acinetobacter sp.]|uniref:DUF4124 domain-containing protein n=1 Tax=Acinetobacter sp. TaxID=472 RepID=UPI0026486094|nr:DUF4124 domain-containing protein [Acinetobacter sp.]MDN5513140.1 DUF4124 domain-containing protein [Acinetobacter sp.]MDN5525780.1 DUF4124 domain-containing protein [Acinetobacter sp.]